MSNYESENNDSFSSAESFNYSKTGNLSNLGDRDFYRKSVVAGEQLNITFFKGLESGAPSALKVYNPNGILVTTQTFGVSGQFSFTPISSGDYRFAIEADSFLGFEETYYTLTISDQTAIMPLISDPSGYLQGDTVFEDWWREGVHENVHIRDKNGVAEQITIKLFVPSKTDLRMWDDKKSTQEWLSDNVYQIVTPGSTSTFSTGPNLDWEIEGESFYIEATFEVQGKEVVLRKDFEIIDFNNTAPHQFHRSTHSWSEVRAIVDSRAYNFALEKNADNIIKYSFKQPDSSIITGAASIFYPYIKDSEVSLSDEYKTLVRGAFDDFASITGINFVETSSTTDVDIFLNEAALSDVLSASGIALPNQQLFKGGVTDDLIQFVWYDSSHTSISGSTFFEQNLVYHEIGHALGLSHPHGGMVQMVESEDDSTLNTIMSYNSHLADLGPETEQVLGKFDMAGLRWIYGNDGIGGNYGVETNNQLIYGLKDGFDYANGGSGDDVYVDKNTGWESYKANGGNDTYFTNRDISKATIEHDQGSWSYDAIFADGTVILQGVGRLRNNDTAVSLHYNNDDDQVYRLYKAAFDREPDAVGLGFWIYKADQDMNLIEMSSRFIDSNEFRSLYGISPSNGEFITKVYENVLDRTPEQSGYDWWLDELTNNPEKTWEKVLADFSESWENKNGTRELIENGFYYTPFDQWIL